MERIIDSALQAVNRLVLYSSSFVERPRYIAVEGPIGVGKTVLAEMLAKEFKARLLREPTEENAMLRRFYHDPEKHAFQMQLFFMFARYQQQKPLMQLDLFEQGLVSDYFFEKDRVFAHLNLSDDELALYEKIYALLARDIMVPDLVIYLQASPEVLMRRIRGRDYIWERELRPDYLEALVQAYNHFFFHYDRSPLLVVNTNEIDFVAEDGDFKSIIKAIREMRGGVQHLISRVA